MKAVIDLRSFTRGHYTIVRAFRNDQHFKNYLNKLTSWNVKYIGHHLIN